MIFGNRIVPREYCLDYDRINEIDEFVDEFNTNLLNSEKRHKKNLLDLEIDKSKLLKIQKKNSYNFDSKLPFVQKTKIRHPVMKFNLSPSGSEFNKIEFSEKETHPSSWDISRIFLSKRSYAKFNNSKKPPFRPIVPAVGREFGFNKGKLSPLGESIVNNMVLSNKLQEKRKIDTENYINYYKKSKPEIVFNSWKIDEKPLDFINKVELEKFRFQKIRSDLISGKSRFGNKEKNGQFNNIKNSKTEGNLELSEITNLNQLKDLNIFD